MIFDFLFSAFWFGMTDDNTEDDWKHFPSGEKATVFTGAPLIRIMAESLTGWHSMGSISGRTNLAPFFTNTSAKNEKLAHMYQTKKVGSHWLIRHLNGQFHRLTISDSATHVEVSDNFLVVDESIYEIQHNGETISIAEVPVVVYKEADIGAQKKVSKHENRTNTLQSTTAELEAGSKEITDTHSTKQDARRQHFLTAKLQMKEDSKNLLKAKSGIWSGFYKQSSVQFPFNMELEFQGSNVTGSGVDGIGKFTIKGTVSKAGEVVFVKQYIGKHNVDYKGKLNKNGLEMSGAYTLGGLRDSFTMKCENSSVKPT